MNDRAELDVDGKTLIQLMAFLAIVAAIIGGIAAYQGTSSHDERLDASGSTMEIDRDAESLTLEDSAGNAIAHGSGTSYVSVPSDGDVGDGNTTVVTWTSLNASALQSDNYHVATLGDGRASIQFRSGSWYGFYNKTGGGVAEVTAPAQFPEVRSQVGIRANGTHLALVHDGQVQNATAFSDGDASVPPARSWWGMQDELRVWGTPLDDSQLAGLASDPIGPTAEDDATLRMMLDEGSGTQTYAVVPGAQGSLSGDVRWTDQGLPPTEFTAGNYTHDQETGVITIAEGSRLDQLHVAYATYTVEQDTILGDSISGLSLLGLLMLVAVLVYVREVMPE